MRKSKHRLWRTVRCCSKQWPLLLNTNDKRKGLLSHYPLERLWGLSACLKIKFKIILLFFFFYLCDCVSLGVDVCLDA